MASRRRGPWSQSEDAYLVQLVHTQGALNWVRIAQLIGSRSPKQCRERYHQNLKPSLNHEPISPEEGLQIERMVREMGKRWAEIARRLHGRSDNAVKNWWNGSMNRRRRMVVRRSAGPRYQNYVEDEVHSPLSYGRASAEPVSSHSLSINSSFPEQRFVENALPSPASSDSSRADSVDGAPSLISDHSSNISISPRAPASPSMDLPPLNGSLHFQQQSSLPTLQLTSLRKASVDDHCSRTYESPRAPSRHSAHHQTMSSSFQQSEYPFAPRNNDLETLHRTSVPAPPSTPSTFFQLPPLLGLKAHGRSAGRDSRMHLSSLLD